MKSKLIVIPTLLSEKSCIRADLDAGQQKAAVCASCYGIDGMSTTDLYPNLAGQKAAYLAKQLRNFKDGNRKDPSMAIFAMQLEDEDIETSLHIMKA